MGIAVPRAAGWPGRFVADDCMPRKPPPPKRGQEKPLREEPARDAIAHEEEAPGGKVRMSSRVVLSRSAAEALAARSIREEKNLPMRVTEILEAAAQRGV
jgi:hypothetical protein